MGQTASRYARLLGTLWRSLKAEATSNRALGVWARCMSYATDNETDGFIPASYVEGFCKLDGRQWRRVLDELTEPKMRRPGSEPTPWLHRVEHGYCIHNYTEENITRAQSEQRRGGERDRKAASRAERKQPLSPDVTPDKPPVSSVTSDTGHKTQDSGHKTQDTESDCAGLVPSPAAPKPLFGPSSASGRVWSAYADAYRERYGCDPTRNAKVNSQIKAFVGRVPADDAPAIAATYVRSNNRRYVGAGHSVGCLLQDAEKLRTELLTGRQGTAHGAHKADKQAGRLGEYEQVFAQLRAEDEAEAEVGYVE